MYLVLNPNHAEKPQVNGWASSKVRENLNRSLVAITSNDNKTVHISCRLLEKDAKNTTFKIYRSVQGKEEKLNETPIEKTTDFIDENPSLKEVEYWVKPLVNGEKLEASEIIKFDKKAAKPYKK